MSVVEIPVQTVERTGFISGFDAFFIKATAAIMAHLIDVRRRAHIRFRAYNTAIGKFGSYRACT